MRFNQTISESIRVGPAPCEEKSDVSGLGDARVTLEKSADVSELLGRLCVCRSENNNMLQFKQTKEREDARARANTPWERASHQSQIWLPPEKAPLDIDLTVKVCDGVRPPYELVRPCRRTASGWVRSEGQTPLAVTTVGWMRFKRAVGP
jgi:hypothetical protein